jgi:hypothetical protein
MLQGELRNHHMWGNNSKAKRHDDSDEETHDSSPYCTVSVTVVVAVCVVLAAVIVMV